MQHFRTDRHEPRQRYDYWHSLVEQSYASCDGRAADRLQFSGALRSTRCGDAELTEVASSPIAYNRSHRHVRTSGTDDYFVAVVLEGEQRYLQNDRSASLRPGSVLLYDSGRPYDFDIARSYRSVLLRLPRPMVESRFHQGGELGGLMLDRARPQAALIGSLLQNMLATAEEADLPMSFVSPVLDVIAGAFALGSDSLVIKGRSAPPLDRIKHYLRQRVADDGLTVGQICTDQNLSVRSLNRLFAAEGTTPMTWLRNFRLAEAHSMLAEGRCRSVTEAAFSCGFNDLSYFGRCFRKRYGFSPKDAMKARR